MLIQVTNPNRDAYERDLAERQRRHLEAIGAAQPWSPCMHDSCPECVGTGVRANGGACVHMISCPCPRCTPRFQ